jgi:D-alanyl-D-alanine carboxypeptidase/D-alanyl-D-alanine-endopeptidase (penicillin-binding protein 4)
MTGNRGRQRRTRDGSGRLVAIAAVVLVLVQALGLQLLFAQHAWPGVPAGRAAAAPDTTLPEPVARTAQALRIPQSAIGLWVQAVDERAPRVAFNGDQPMNPASVLKLVTTFAALEGLGPTYSWETGVYLDRPLGPDGVAQDVWIRGGGDPYLVVEEYWKLLAGLFERGLRRIDGDLVFDLSRFNLPVEDRGAFDGQPDRVYNVLPHALLVNFTAAQFRVEARRDGTVGVTVDPPLPNLAIVNNLRPAAGPCGGYQFGVGLAVQGAAARDRAVLEGAFPTACREFELTRSVLQPESYAWGLFSAMWAQQGGEMRGGWRFGAVPAGARPLYVHQSRPLGDLIRLVNKFSNNVMTRHFEYALAAERLGAPATPDKGHQAIVEVLTSRGIDTTGVVIGNSAGLARETRISPRQLGAVLDAAWRSPWMPEYMASLSLAGLDGTMRARFRAAPATGRMHLKTGRLDDVSAVAGYVKAASGRRMMVVLLLNAPKAHLGPGVEVQDAFLKWVYTTY